MNNIQKIFEKINLNRKHTASYSEKKMIFICGMPRSGTTLVEQISCFSSQSIWIR
jgi:hypothetical protein